MHKLPNLPQVAVDIVVVLAIVEITLIIGLQ